MTRFTHDALRYAFASMTVDVLVLLAAVLAGLLIGGIARLTEQTARAVTPTGSAAEADRMRTALLQAVSHDLRSPLAAAAVAVSGLRSADLQLTAADRDDLLATAAESLDLLARLAASLLDVTRLQAGARSVFPRPACLEEIITGALASLEPQARSMRVTLPPGLPEVLADPPITERVIANLAANALRYSPAGSPPLLTARTRRGRVELRVADHGRASRPPTRTRYSCRSPAWRNRPGHRSRARPRGGARSGRGDGRHARTGTHSRRRADHDPVPARGTQLPMLRRPGRETRCRHAR